MGRIPFVVATLFMLAGCSTEPSVAGGKNALIAFLSQHYPNAKVIVSAFEKTKGHQEQVKGVDGYVTEFKATAEFPEGYRLDCDPNENLPRYPDCPTLGPIGAGAPQPAGTGLNLTGTVELQRFDTGWQAVAVKVADAKPFDMVAANDYFLKKPCPKLTDPADDERIEKSAGIEPQKNRVTVDANGMKWNGTTINEDTLRQFLGATMNITPLPLLHVEVKKGASLTQVQRVWRVVRRSGMCGIGPFES
jgi:hypothetical protein